MTPAEKMRQLIESIRGRPERSDFIADEDAAAFLALLDDAIARETRTCLALVQGQDLAPDTMTGRRQRWLKEQIAGKIQARLPDGAAPGAVCTHDCPVELDALLERLAGVDGRNADCAVVVWEQCQLLVREIRLLRGK